MIGGIGLALNHQDSNLFDQLYAVWRKRRQANITRSTSSIRMASARKVGVEASPK